jgi:hypothetical protein
MDEWHCNNVAVTVNVVADLISSTSSIDTDFVVKLINVFLNNLSHVPVDIYAEKDPIKLLPSSCN